jgi:hypothetical protein
MSSGGEGTPSPQSDGQIETVGEATADQAPKDAHAYLIEIYRDEAVAPSLRIKAAQAALPYEKAHLKAVAMESASRVDTPAQTARRAELRAKLDEAMKKICQREADVAAKERDLIAQGAHLPLAAPQWEER